MTTSRTAYGFVAENRLVEGELDGGEQSNYSCIIRKKWFGLREREHGVQNDWVVCGSLQPDQNPA